MNKNVSFSDAMLYLAGNNIRFLDIEQELKGYIHLFSENLKNIDFISGALLFGSVAKLSYQNYSDIGIL